MRKKRDALRLSRDKRAPRSSKIYYNVERSRGDGFVFSYFADDSIAAARRRPLRFVRTAPLLRSEITRVVRLPR